MKPRVRRLFFIGAFVFLYAFFLSLGIECLLNTWPGVAGWDGAADPYPRFLPFCRIMGIMAFVFLLLTAIFNYKKSEKLAYTKDTWIVQSLLAFALSIPAIKLWELLFQALHQLF